MCDIRRVARIIGALPRETAGLFQEVPLNSRITPWVFNMRSNLNSSMLVLLASAAPGIL